MLHLLSFRTKYFEGLAKHFYKVKIRNVNKETPDCVSIEFDITDELWPLFQFKQGQNITIKSHLDEGRRTYSICSSPLENKLKVAVKRVPKGVFSSYALEKLQPGDELEIMQPAGSFFTELHPSHKKYYIFFAAGSGITPIISIIKSVLAIEEHSTVALVYGNKNLQNIIFKEELEALKNRYMNRLSLTYVLSREQTESPINTGRIDKEKCESLNPLLQYEKADEFFICGPEQMIFTVKDFLMEIGIPASKIHFELFAAPATTTKKPQVKETGLDEYSNVTITVDGRTFEVPVPYQKVTILDAGLDRGINLPYSCKAGVCTTCRAKLLQGQVVMDCNYGLEDYEVEQGYILTCQSHPQSPECKVDFDA